MPLLLLLVSAGAGVWIAYDKPAAWLKFFLIVGGLVIFELLARIPERVSFGKSGEAPVLEWILGVLPALVALYFFLMNDWASRIGKVPMLDPAIRWFAAWQPDVANLRLNSNVIGGLIAALLPLQIVALFRNQARSRIWAGIALVALASLGLLMSESRGAWLALAIVLIAWAAKPRGSSRSRFLTWAGAVVLVLLVFVLILALTPLGEHVLTLRSDRLIAWRNSLDLASDYAFTGLGLGNFEMAYSSYVLLVHVGHTIHAHNLYLDIWLEQGLLGLLALGALIVTAVWPRRSTDRWTTAASASLFVILLHGLVDDAFYGYGGRGVVLLFMPFALLARSIEKPRLIPAMTLWSAALLALVMVAFTPGARAAWLSNWGAVSQTQAELAVYRWPEWPIQDALRRSDNIDLTRAITQYQSALALNPTNATARRRLGQIELSRGEYELARRDLQVAFASAPGQRASRQLLGESYAVAGETEQAVALWRTVDTGQGQLQARAWWYAEFLQDHERTARLNQAVAALNR